MKPSKLPASTCLFGRQGRGVSAEAINFYIPKQYFFRGHHSNLDIHGVRFIVTGANPPAPMDLFLQRDRKLIEIPAK